MTFEGYLVIFIALLALIKVVSDRKQIALGKKSCSKLDLLAMAFLCTANIALVIYCSRIIFALVLVNTFAWLAFHAYMKSIKYSILSWFSIVIYWLYVYATYTNFKQIPVTEIWQLTLFVWFGTMLMLVVYDTIGRFSKWISSALVSLLGLVFLLPAFVFVLYNKAFNLEMNVAQLNAIYQSNLREAYEFAITYASFFQLVLIPTLLLGLIFVLFYQGYASKSNLKSPVYFKVVIFLFVIANLNLLETLALPGLIINTKNIYASELAKFRKELNKRKVGEVKYEAVKEEDKELYVVVIGESLNKNHMSLYGYHRSTTPLLDSIYKQGSIVKYENAFSNHTHTIPVLTQALTTANQLNGETYFSSLSILDVLEEAEFDTYWLSNQVSFGEWDNPISVLADRADHRININTNVGKVTQTNFLDGRLVEELDKIVSDGIDKNTVVFLHVMGNHGAYKNRYEAQYDVYNGKLPKAEFGENKYWAKNVNEYDNSILYQDKILTDVFDVVKKYSGTSACLYFSDHSEDVFANMGHNASSFTFAMTQTPLFAWFSEAYQSKYSDVYQNFISNNDVLFSNDFIYDLLVDFTGVKTDHYEYERSLMNASYSLSDKECFTLHRKKRYADDKNTFYHQKKNLAIIDSLYLNSKIYPHRVNTTGKLSEVIYAGCTSVEVDLIFKQEQGYSYFEVGHDSDALSGISFEEFLKAIGERPLEKIWLDIKNLNQSNVLALEKRLVDLDAMYSIKKRAIVETTSEIPGFSRLRDLGFHTSFYIPTNLKNLDESQFKSKALEIAKQVAKQNVAAVSFDSSLYSFVKTYLESHLDRNVVYHTWDVKLKLKDKDFWSKISSRALLSDTRVNSVLVKFHSSFEL